MEVAIKGLSKLAKNMGLESGSITNVSMKGTGVRVKDMEKEFSQIVTSKSLERTFKWAEKLLDRVFFKIIHQSIQSFTHHQNSCFCKAKTTYRSESFIYFVKFIPENICKTLLS